MTQTLALPSLRGRDRRGARPRRRAGQLVGRRERGAGRRRLLADLPRPPAAARGPRRLRGGRPLRGRRALRDRRRGAPRRVRRRVVRASGAGAAARRRLAALRLLRHARTPSTGGSRRSTPTSPRGLETAPAPSSCPAPTRSRSRTRSSLVDETGWRMWVCVHPLTEPGHEDRMTTAYATSADGLAWDWHGTVLAPTPGTWDQRGARVTAVLSASTRSSCCTTAAPAPRTTGTRSPGSPAPTDGRHAGRRRTVPVIRSPHTDGALRYVAAVPLPGRRHPVLLRGRPARRCARPDDQRSAD